MKILSLFSGAGGLDLGFEYQGFTPISAYDKKASAVATYNFNRPKRPIAKIANLANPMISSKIIDAVDALGPSNEPIGVIGGPPCQYFSNGNKSERDSLDERRLLPRRYARILHKLNEKYQIDFFIFENVDGLTKPRHTTDFKKLLELFEEAGFFIEYKVLDAYNFGVPQHRNRVFIVGWNNKLYPEKVYEFPQGNPSNLTVRDALENLAPPIFYKKGLDPSVFPIHPNHWTMVPRSDKFNNPAPKDLRKTVRSFRRLEWDEPSYTVAYGHNEIHIHPNGDRRLSIYEAMLLQGFPREKNGYCLVGSFSDQVSLISDAVPPPLANALASSIKKFIKKNHPKNGSSK